MSQTKTTTTDETTTRTTTRTTTFGRTATGTLEAWARHATSSNGFGDAFTLDTNTLPFTRS